MKFFKPEDFQGALTVPETLPEYAARFANEKLEREGRLVFAEYHNPPWNNVSFQEAKFRATLINIEPTEFCKHPTNKLSKLALISRSDITKCIGGYSHTSTLLLEISM